MKFTSLLRRSLLVFLFAFLCPSGFAQTEGNPTDIQIQLRLLDGQGRFRQGEIIPLELRIASRVEGKYKIDTTNFDRSGRIEIDRFHLTPREGVVNPMFDYYDAEVASSMGGLSGENDLGWEPFDIVYQLNEWFRFDRPGRYRIYVTSPRVRIIHAREGEGEILLTSNPVEFEIVPADRRWKEQEFRNAVRKLNGKPTGRNDTMACRTLRFLGTKPAALEMIRRLGESDSDCSFQYMAGLIGSPHREFVQEKLLSQMLAPEQPVSNLYLESLIKFEMIARRMEFQATASENAQTQWENKMRARQESQKKYAEQLAAAIKDKTGAARSLSLMTLLQAGWDLKKMPGILSFIRDLPLQSRMNLLHAQWKEIANPALLPFLRELYKLSSMEAGSPYDARSVRTLALEKIYELAPEEGRKLILSEMSRPAPQVNRSILESLPEKSLPELDSILADHFERGEMPELHAALILRYGSPALLPRARSWLNERIGKMPCYEQSCLLQFCLRWDPAGTLELVHRGAKEREHTRCYDTILRGAGKFLLPEEADRLAIEYLHDPDPDVALDAVVLLGEHGSEHAEDLLWRQFEEWHRQWLPRSEDLQRTDDFDPLIAQQRSYERTLVHALSLSPTWLADRQKLERLARLCLSASSRQMVERMLAAWQKEIRISYDPLTSGWGNASVAQYHFNSLANVKNKLDQFPSTTVFRWHSGATDPAKEAVFQEIQSHLSARGVTVNR